MKKIKEQTYFSKDWLADPIFKDWIVKAPDKTEARCRLCSKNFKLSNMGRQALVSHANGKTHKIHFDRKQMFFKISKPSVQSVLQEDKESSSIPENNSSSVASPKIVDSPKLDMLLNNSQKQRAEIIWALKVVCSSFSNNSCSDISQIFKCMFPDSAIAKSFELGADKLKYVINFGIAPYFKDILDDILKKSNHYVISFDESLNDITQNCQMDILVRFFDEIDQKVKVRYLDSRFIGHSTHQDLFNHFTDAIAKLNNNNIYQISMDGPSVNLKFLEKVQNERRNDEQHELINIGSCGLHTIHGAFKGGVESSGWNMKQTLHGAYQILHASPARRDDYQTITGSDIFPFNFCVTRWIEDLPVAERLLLIWDNICKLAKHWDKLPKYKQPSSKSYLNVKSAVDDVLTKVKLKFFCFVAGILKPFLTKYQSDRPMVPYLYKDIIDMIKKLMYLIVKPDIIDKCVTLTDYRNIDLDKKDSMVKAKNINIGFGAKAEITKLKARDIISSAMVAKFLTESSTFVITILKKLLDKSPAGSNVVRNASIFDPSVILSEKSNVLQKRLSSLLTHLMKLNILKPQKCDKITEQYIEFVTYQLKFNIASFQKFEKDKKDLDEKDLDDFYFTDLNLAAFPDLSFLIKMILTLSHGQAAVERSFSINNSVLNLNMKEDSIVAKKIVKDHMISNGLKPNTINISNKLIRSVASARQKYKDSLAQSQVKNKKKKNDNEKIIIAEELRVLNAKRIQLQKISDSLNEEFVASVKLAEEKMDITLVSKANALKRKSEEKGKEVLKLDEAIELIKEKRQKLD